MVCSCFQVAGSEKDARVQAVGTGSQRVERKELPILSQRGSGIKGLRANSCGIGINGAKLSRGCQGIPRGTSQSTDVFNQADYSGRR
jgi:hypothetical protein